MADDKYAKSKYGYEEIIYDKNSVALAYGVNMLCLLLSMRLISESEYRSILKLQAEHYDPQKKFDGSTPISEKPKKSFSCASHKR